MNGSGDDGKPAQTGLVDMGLIHFYDDNIAPTFTLSDLANCTGSVSEMVLNVTWAQLQPTEGGALVTTAIDDAIAQVVAYNSAHGTTLGIKLRVWGGVTAPDWAKNIDGPALTITGQASIDPTNYTPRTVGRVWTADYIDAWSKLQGELAGLYDSNPVIRGISQTAGGIASDEPFVPLSSAAPISNAAGAPTVNQLDLLKAGGYTDAAEMLTLRAAIADYAAWSTTPLDYTFNPFHLIDGGTAILEENFAIAVLQQARNSTRLVQAGNHALDAPQHSQLPFLYAQLTADAAMTTAAAPYSYQTASPDLLATHSGSYPAFTGDYSNWPNAIFNGVQANGGDIELWDFSGPAGSGVNGFLNLTTSQMAFLAQLVANGVAPVTGAPDDGSALGFLAPAFITGAAGAISFSGTNALLLASAAAQTSYSVTLSSLNSHALAVVDHSGIVSGSTSGTTLTFSGTLDQVNTVLASLTDSLASGTDVVHIAATDTGGHSAARNVGVQVVAAGSSSSSGPQTPPAFQGNGITVLGGVQASLGFAGNLQIGPGGYTTTLFAALSPSAYATATLSVANTFEVMSGGAAYVTGAVTAATVQVDSGGLLNGGGVISASLGGAIVNSGTIEAMADTTLGLQRLEVVNALTGSGTLLIDAGATLLLSGAVGSSQLVQFAPNTAAQLANSPYTPSTLVLAAPLTMSAPISGFTYADRLVLQGVTITGASYAGSSLSVQTSGGVLSYTLSGSDLASLTLDTSSATLAQGIIRFLPPASPTLPGGTVVDQIVVSGGKTIETGQVTASGSGGVAVSVDGGGTLALAGGAVVTAGQAAIVGNAGSGLMVVMGGALALTGSSASNALVLGAQGAGAGTVVNLEQITASGTVVVGEAGSGTLSLLGVAASLSNGNADIGQDASAHGTVLVNGGEWMNAGTLTIGNAGSGSLTIDGSHNGITGQVTAYNATIANQAGGHGTVLLDGGEMLVANFNAALSTLAVGVAGIADLTLDDGSEIAVGYALASAASNTGRLTVGSAIGGQGHVTIGSNSAVLVYGNATVGGAGTGVVTVGESPGDIALLALLGTLAVDGNGTVDLGGANATVRATTIDIAHGGLISGAGTLLGDLGGNQTVRPAIIDNNGTIVANGGNLLVYGDITGTGTLSITSGATMTLEGAVGSGQTLAFAPHAKLVIADPGAFHGTITGFTASDTLEIGGVQATGVSWSSNLLTIALPSGSLQYALTGNYASGFAQHADGLGGTNVQANPGSVGGGDGDVHMTTFDGLHYDFQAVGDFVAVQSTDSGNPWEIQVRTTGLPGVVSFTDALGTMAGDDQVTFAVGRDSLVYVDGAPDSDLHAGDVQTLAGGTLARLSDTVYRLDWNTGDSVTVTNTAGAFLDWSVGLGPHHDPGSVHGLLGSHGGQANDFQLPDGTVLAQPLSAEQIHTIYADAWRVAPGASLLDDAHGPALSQLVQAMATGLVSTGTGQPATQWAEDASSYAPIEFIPVASSF